MKLTEDQKKRIILAVGEREDDNLTVPLLEDYIFPLVERTEEDILQDAESLKYELRSVAFDFLLAQLRVAIPDKSDQELVEAMPPEQLQGTIVFAALTLQAVLSQLRYESAVAITAHEDAQGLDEELQRLLEEK